MGKYIILISILMLAYLEIAAPEVEVRLSEFIGVTTRTFTMILWGGILVLLIKLIASSPGVYANISEGHVGVVSRFSRFSRTLSPGFNFIYPWERVERLSIQSRAIELKFQAITLDQARVYFNCAILFSVVGSDKEMVRRAVYSFRSESEFELSVQRLLEDETRAYVATRRQAEMIGISQDVVVKIKTNVEKNIEKWGYKVEDLRYANLHFDEVVTKSMARVVAAVNERDAAENEGQALLIRKIKAAEAEGEFVRIQAEAERTAWKLRGQGLSDFRVEVAKGVHIAVNEMAEAGLDPNFLLFFMYTETLKHIAENSGAGSTIFVDNNPSVPNSIMQQMSAFYKKEPTQESSENGA